MKLKNKIWNGVDIPRTILFICLIAMEAASRHLCFPGGICQLCDKQYAYSLLRCVACDRSMCLFCSAETEERLEICKPCASAQPTGLENMCDAPGCWRQGAPFGPCGFCRFHFKVCKAHVKKCGNHTCGKVACPEHHHCAAHAFRCAKCRAKSSHHFKACSHPKCKTRLCDNCRGGLVRVQSTEGGGCPEYYCGATTHSDLGELVNCHGCDRIGRRDSDFTLLKLRGRKSYGTLRVCSPCACAARKWFLTVRRVLLALPRDLRWMVYAQTGICLPHVKMMRCDFCRELVDPFKIVKVRRAGRKPVFVCKSFKCSGSLEQSE